jgi:hypothetical protein
VHLRSVVAANAHYRLTPPVVGVSPIKLLLTLLFLGAWIAAASLAFSITGGQGSDEPRAQPPTATSTASPTPTGTATVTPTPDYLPTDQPAPPPPPPPTATLVSQVLSEARPPSQPAPPPVQGGTYLPLPNGVSVAWGGCASDGTCHWYNFYWAPTLQIVMQAGEGQHKVQHEYCHAHQHWSINGGAPLSPSNYDLQSWYATSEGQSFAAATSGEPWPWTHSAVNGLEDFAWTCAYWYVDPGHLFEVSPARYRWAQQSLP